MDELIYYPYIYIITHGMANYGQLGPTKLKFII